MIIRLPNLLVTYIYSEADIQETGPLVPSVVVNHSAPAEFLAGPNNLAICASSPVDTDIPSVCQFPYCNATPQSVPLNAVGLPDEAVGLRSDSINSTPRTFSAAAGRAQVEPSAIVTSQVGGIHPVAMSSQGGSMNSSSFNVTSLSCKDELPFVACKTS
jgi:hypothetical protein